jgi:hypothetical protein
MVEVFKTNVNDSDQANTILDLIRNIFPDDKVNFDLDDCDSILRVESKSDSIDASSIIALLNSLDFKGEVLSDDVKPVQRNSFLKAEASIK